MPGIEDEGGHDDTRSEPALPNAAEKEGCGTDGLARRTYLRPVDERNWFISVAFRDSIDFSSRLPTQDGMFDSTLRHPVFGVTRTDLRQRSTTVRSPCWGSPAHCHHMRSHCLSRVSQGLHWTTYGRHRSSMRGRERLDLVRVEDCTN